MENEKGRCTNTLSFPELRRSEVGVCLTTLLARQEKEINHPMGWISPEACYAMAHAHLAYYRAMERGGYLRMVKTSADLQSHVEQYQKRARQDTSWLYSNHGGGRSSSDSDTIFEFHELGLRAIGLTHYGGNRYGGGTRTEIGLAADAIPLIKNIETFGMTVDLTHLSDKAFWQMIRPVSWKGACFAQNSRRICNWQRQFSDDNTK